jgi:hypothetical protein
MHVLIFDIWMTVSDYNTNRTVIILVGIGNFPEMHVLFICIWMTVLVYNYYQSHSNYTSWDWNLAEMHVLIFYIWLTVSDYNTNSTVIILVGIGIFPKCMF